MFQDAVNYPLVISVKKEKPDAEHEVKVCTTNTVGNTMCFSVPQSELPLDQRDIKSPWLIAPLHVIKAFRRIQSLSARLGDLYEVHMGVKTSADKLFVVDKIVNCSDGLASVQLVNGKRINIEEDILHPFVRGRDINPLSFEPKSCVIFTHDVETLEPLWDDHQKKVLQSIGVLNQSVEVDCAGSTLVYSLNAPCGSVVQRVNALVNAGFTVKPVTPCAVSYCLDIMQGGLRVLSLRLEATGQQTCRVYVDGLTIPGKPHATKHFLSYLCELVRRDDYRANLPPWSIFRVSQDKFRDYRIAWQEIAKHFEACVLPVKMKTLTYGESREVLVIPNVKVYFIAEPDHVKALKLLIYLNSDLASSLLKLRALTTRGGYYEHQATSVAHLPIPRALLECKLWKLVDEYASRKTGTNLNEIAEEIYEKHARELVDELIENMGITREEYNALVEYSKWLNELGEAIQEEIEEEE